jgi:hypothetical protein
MNFINATALNGKSGGAKWRDLLFYSAVSEMFFDRAKRSGQHLGA